MAMNFIEIDVLGDKNLTHPKLILILDKTNINVVNYYHTQK